MADVTPFPGGFFLNSEEETFDFLEGEKIYTRRFHGPWANRDTFISNWLEGWLGESSNVAVITSPPAHHRDDDTFYKTAFPIRYTVTGSGADDGVARETKRIFADEVGPTLVDREHIYDRANIEVTYQTFTYADLGNWKFVTEEFQSEVEVLDVSDKSEAAETNSTLIENAFINTSRYDIEVRVHNIWTQSGYKVEFQAYDKDAVADGDVENVLLDLLFYADKAGWVNHASITSFSGHVFDAFTLKFDNHTSRNRNVRHNKYPNMHQYHTELHFTYNPITWKKRYDLNDSGQFVTKDIDPPLIPGFMDFTAVFPKLFI